MNRHSHVSVFVGVAFVATLLQLSLVGCGPSDPLEAILDMQSRGKFEESLEPLRDLLAERPGDAEVLFIYGRTLSVTGKSGLAEWSLREAMRDPDWLVPAGTMLAIDSARSHNYEAAIGAATQVLDAEPDNVDALVIRSSAYAHSRMNHEAALEDVDRILELDPDNMQVLEAKILALLGLERIEEVAEAMEELGRRIDEGELGDGTTAWHCATTAIFANDSGNTELANTRWTNCLEAHPADGEVVSKAVVFYDGLGRYDRSLEILSKAVELDPNARALRVNLSYRLLTAGEVEKAEELLVAATQSERPNFASASWLDLAKHYQAVENYGAAADAVGKAVEIVESVSKPDASLLLEYADSLLIAGRFDESREVAKQMTHTPHLEMIRARIAQEEGDYELALEHFKKAFQLWPDNPFGRYYAALTAESLGDFDMALEQYRYSIRISPGATDSRIRAARIHKAERRYGVAVQLLRIKAHEEPLDLSGELLSLELWAVANRPSEIQQTINKIRAGSPTYIGEALARAAKGGYDRGGAAAAVSSLRRAGEIDLADANYAGALRALVAYSYEAEDTEQIEAELEEALTANPASADLLEVAAFRLELMGAPADEVNAGFRRVLAIEPEHTLALSGLGRALEKAGKSEEALAYIDRAAASDPDNVALQLLSIRAQQAAGGGDGIETRLESLRDLEPFNGEVSRMLAELRLGRSQTDAETLDLARRAVRFGGGIDELELLARVHAARNETELAREASERAEALAEALEETQSS